MSEREANCNQFLKIGRGVGSNFTMLAILAWSRGGKKAAIRTLYLAHLINFLCKTTIAYLSELIGNFLRGVSNLKRRRRIGSTRGTGADRIVTRDPLLPFPSFRLECRMVTRIYAPSLYPDIAQLNHRTLYFPENEKILGASVGFIVSLCTNFTRMDEKHTRLLGI